MLFKRIAAPLLAMVLLLSTAGLAAAAEPAEDAPYEWSISEELGTKTETYTFYNYEIDATEDVELEVVLVPDGAELSVASDIDLSAVVMQAYEIEDGVFDDWMPVYWTVDGSTSGLNFIEQGTTASAVFEYDESMSSLYKFDVWQEGMELAVYFQVQPAADDEAQPASEEQEEPVEDEKAIALPTPSKVLVNGESVDFEAYNINDNNYFKLRDIAAAVNGSEKQFEVSWSAEDNAISLISGQAYTLTGGELEKSENAGNQEAVLTKSGVILDGEQVQLTAYNIDGFNYFKLRDLAKALQIGITWDAETNTIGIDTSIGYEE